MSDSVHWAAIVTSAGSALTGSALIIGGLQLREQRRQFRAQLIRPAVHRARQSIKIVRFVVDGHGFTYEAFDERYPLTTDWEEIADVFGDAGFEDAAGAVRALISPAFEYAGMAQMERVARTEVSKAGPWEDNPVRRDAVDVWVQARQARTQMEEPLKQLCAAARSSVDNAMALASGAVRHPTRRRPRFARRARAMRQKTLSKVSSRWSHPWSQTPHNEA